jgi:hypothetical protein
MLEYCLKLGHDLFLLFPLSFIHLFKIPSDPFTGKRETTGYRMCHFSLQNVPFTKEQVKINIRKI